MHKTILVPKLMHLFIKEHFKGKYTWHTCLPPPFSPPPLKRDIENCIKLKAFIPFWAKWNKNCITTMEWKYTCRPSDACFPKERTAATFFQPSLAWAPLAHAILMRSIFISRHSTIHLRPRLTSELLHRKRNIYRCCCNDKMRIAY